MKIFFFDLLWFPWRDISFQKAWIPAYAGMTDLSDLRSTAFSLSRFLALSHRHLQSVIRSTSRSAVLANDQVARIVDRADDLAHAIREQRLIAKAAVLNADVGFTRDDQ